MSSATSHRSRKKRKATSSSSATANEDLVFHDSVTNTATPAFPLVAFIWPARGLTSRWLTLPIILMTVGLFRWTTGLWGFSGYDKPPMHGDFEAQRHWMEITSHLPVSSWYFYDLQYWGLDYPPLTAYHSWLCGKIGSIISPTWFALDQSRGNQDHLLKIFMRATVIVSEYLTYVPAVVFFQRQISRMNSAGSTASSVALVAILMQPATLIIDHGHFQYNTVMLGFVVAAISCFLSNHVAWGSAFFVAALGFKQMALYYSPLVFAYLLGSCISPRVRPGRLILIALATITSFAALFAPLLGGALYEYYRSYLSLDTELAPPPLLPELLSQIPINIPTSSPVYTMLLQVTQAIHRIFPFARGLFEDKVANFWCLINHTVLKLTAIQAYTNIPLPRLSLLVTLASIIPSSLLISVSPRKSNLLPALATCAWGFFLFSFQVHEKSVLLPLLPMTLMLGASNGLSREIRSWVGFANILGTWTMYPLLKRDELRTPYFVLTFLWAYLLGLPPTTLSLYMPKKDQTGRSAPDGPNILTTLIHLSFYTAMLAWHVLEGVASPPKDKPDLFIVLNVLIGAMGFGICYLWCTWKTLQGSGLLDRWLEEQEKRDQSPAVKAPPPTPRRSGREKTPTPRATPEPAPSKKIGGSRAGTPVPASNGKGVAGKKRG